MTHSTRFLSLAALALCGACANHNQPPAASSQTIEASTDRPNRQPDFAPASNDGTAAARNDTRTGAPAPTPAPPGEMEERRPANAKTLHGNDTARSTMAEPETSSPASAETEHSAPDNTRVNTRDRDDSAMLPADQSNKQSDLDVTQQIRKAIMKDDSLSFTAKNVKIITVGGKVTLRGPVKTDAERSAIEAAARSVAGANRVDNQIQVKK